MKRHSSLHCEGDSFGSLLPHAGYKISVKVDKIYKYKQQQSLDLSQAQDKVNNCDFYRLLRSLKHIRI